MLTHDTNHVLACPSCRGALDHSSSGARCQVCRRFYPLRPDGFLDLRLDDSYYNDVVSLSDAARARWLGGVALTESTGAQHMIRNYLVPLLARLGRSDVRILSAGCGGGWDVDELHAAGFAAWGIDNGGRTMVWRERAAREYLSLADALHMPFFDEVFDFVFSEGVIEHIGMGGDSLVGQPDQRAQRIQYAESLLRVTKPGGHLLIACPNRLFPIDFYHGGRDILGMRMRFHSPLERFLPSYRDIRGLFASQAQAIQPLSLSGFFNLDRLAQQSKSAAFSSWCMTLASRLLPDAFWGSALSPYLVILVRKKHAA